MAEYIKRDELLRHYDDYYCKPCREKGDDYHGVRCRACGTGDAIETAEDIPAADVRENVHGKWIDIPNGAMKAWKRECSECGTWRRGKTNYCPNCGAEMKGAVSVNE